jgi:peptidoglycan/LPS O-acetylase OafA/YrhL
VESLRGLGALLVAGHHFSGTVLHGAALVPEQPLHHGLVWAAWGLLPAHAALMLFFVISGFVLRQTLAFGSQRLGPMTVKFLLARFFRIYPIVIVGVTLTALAQGFEVAPLGQAARALQLPEFLANFCLLDITVNAALWALQVEVVMVPVLLVLYLLERSRGPYLLLTVALLSTILAYKHGPLWKPLAINMFAFVLGMTVPTLGRNAVLAMTRRQAIRWTIGAALVLMLTRPCLGLFTRASTVVEGYAATILISLVAYREDISLLGWLDLRALRLLGQSSGSYYVLHMASVPLVVTAASAIIPPLWSAQAPALVAYLLIVPWLLVLTPLMWCSYALVEGPGIALGRRVIGWCRLGPCTPAPKTTMTVSGQRPPFVKRKGEERDVTLKAL